MIKVGVSMRELCEKEYDEQRDAIAQDWIPLLEQFNVLPVLIPNNLDNVKEFINQVGISHLLLTGGNSIGDAKSLNQYFKQCEQFDNGKQAISASKKLSLRDITEVTCLQYALKSKIPVFGVCRGLHLINACFGGDISRSVFNKDSKSEASVSVNHVASVHQIEWRPTGKTIKVNSFHEDAVFENQLASSLTCLALSDDKVVEALCNKNESVVAVQWHPERKGSAEPLDNQLIKSWLKQ